VIFDFFLQTSTRRPDRYVGEKAFSIGETLSLRYPIQRGIITDWDDMELVWQHIFESELKIKSEERNVLLTDSVHTPVGNREKMTQVRRKFQKVKVIFKMTPVFRS
jgi:actin-related protein